MRACTSDTIEIVSATLANSEEILNICDKIASYQENLDSFLLLSNWQNFWYNRSLVAVVTLYLLSYVHSEQSNIFQMVVGHATFAYNILKCAIKTFYQIGLVISYKSIYHPLSANANAVEREMREKIMIYWFFILFNNMNFSKYVRDTCIFIQGVQINYTVEYICFCGLYEQSEDERTLDCIWQNQYLSANFIDYTTVNALYVNNFLLSLADK